MVDENDPVYRAAFAPYQALLDANADAMERIAQESDERAAALKAEQEEHWKQLAAERAEREAAKAEAKPEEEAEKDAKLPNAWAQPTRLPDSAARIGRFEDDDTPRPVAEQPAQRVVAPVPVPSPPPAPVVQPEPAPVSGRHARPDDDDDFESGSFLRG